MVGKIFAKLRRTFSSGVNAHDFLLTMRNIHGDEFFCILFFFCSASFFYLNGEWIGTLSWFQLIFWGWRNCVKTKQKQKKEEKNRPSVDEDDDEDTVGSYMDFLSGLFSCSFRPF